LDQNIQLAKYQIPTPKPISSSKSTIPAATNANLNFLYLFSSGGASELWGKYGGGVYVAI
jgi:hypothetical protein